MAESQEKRGLLVLGTQTGQNEYLDKYHEMYPIASISWMHNGYRLRADDGRQPEYLATYDLDDVVDLGLDKYIPVPTGSGRGEKIMFELDDLDERLYRLISETGAAPDPPAKFVMYVTLSFKPDDVEEVDRWYEEEDIPSLSKVPRWQRTRRYRSIEPITDDDPVELLAVHEYDSRDGFDSPEAKAAGSTAWGTRIVQQLAQKRSRRVFELIHVFP